ncbi:MAG: peptidoglycan DD-metalloendopeptidase family protein, partial [Rhodospirillaceae bacterium]|nr:peptidoglycan DD-metalloendopeptidase family protein [Rhodospirillaceae bacterium]
TGVIIAGAFLSLGYSWGNAPISDGVGGNDSVALAPISLGNPQAAGTLSVSAPNGVTGNNDDAGFFSNLLNSARELVTYEKPVVVKSGDTLAKILERAGANNKQANSVIKSLSGIFDPRSLKINQKIFARFVPAFPSANEAVTIGSDVFAGLVIPLDYRNRIVVSPSNTSDETFVAKKVSFKLVAENVRAEGTIDSSLYLAAANKGVTPPVINELIRIFSWDVDFQRDIWKNDGFEVMYQRFRDEDGNVVYTDGIKYAALTLQGKKKAIYLHQLKDGTTDYFDENGQSARKALMRTPINGARLSSTFGKRKHPVLGYTKMHKGADFAAPTGTPIYAAGNGTIEVSGRNGSYGNYVRIRHNSEYSTAYAHMKAIKRGMGKGKRVTQGEVIGYVGTTGRSTGPHLHYEILRAGRQVNPLRVKMPSGKKLKGDELARFKVSFAEISNEWARLENEAGQLAQK